MAIQSIVIQIAESEHLSEERIIVRYISLEETEEIAIVNKASLTEEELNIYNSFISLSQSKLD